MDDLLRTANKGEWAELYVFFKIMLERVLYAADEDLAPKTEEWFRFFKLYRHLSKGGVQEFDLSEEGKILVSQDGVQFEVLDEGDLRAKTKRILERIKEAKATFHVQDAASLMDTYGLKTVKAGSDSKTDIDADVLISNTSKTQRMGFSVKSYIGGPPTLVNSSSHTNFVYEVIGFNGDVDEINSIDSKSKVRDRIEEIRQFGGSLRYVSMSSESFRKNLRLQDSIYPTIMAEMLMRFYSGLGNDFISLGKMIADDASTGVTETEVAMMTKRYLRSSALGMVPGTDWSGTLSAQGGYIVVLEDGGLVCYNLYFDDDFREYLYTNTRFDTPSTTKYKFGRLYEAGGKLYFNLNLQIRFKRA